MSERLLSGLQPWLRPYVVYALDWMQLETGGRYNIRGEIVDGIRPTITSGFRSLARQQELYQARATNPYPVNRPGDSAHNYGLGFDSDVPDRYMPTWIAVRRAVGFRVPENDEVHGEVPDWRAIVGLRAS